MRVSVLVPTYRRVPDLARCLEGLKQQVRLPDEVVVVTRDTDAESHDFLQLWQGPMKLRVVVTDKGGVVNALNAGLDTISSDVVMITDDDAVPRATWVQQVERHFAANAAIGGVGGRDVVHKGGSIEEKPCRVVGKVQWFGRLVGNHHLIAPRSLYVDILKGVNMSFRMQALGNDRLDTHLRGEGAQVGNETALSLALRSKGWKLLYDPLAMVDHFPAQRFDYDQRGVRDLAAAQDTAFNIWWTLRTYLPRGPRRVSALLWEWMLGTSGRPGWVRAGLARLKGDTFGTKLARAVREGRKLATKELRDRKSSSAAVSQAERA